MTGWLTGRPRALLSFAAVAGALLLASCGGGSGDSTPTPLFGKAVAFGASLSDVGNVCPATPGCPTTPPYATGRYSDGPLWLETVAARYGATVTASSRGGSNYAHAGARTGTPIAGVPTAGLPPSMVAQLASYLSAVKLSVDPSTLFFIDAGTVGNNISDALVLGQTDPTAPSRVVTQAVTDIVNLLVQLHAAGGRHFVVMNSPDIGRTPYVQSLGATAVATASALAAGFNGGLAPQLAGLAATLPGIRIYLMDLGALDAEIAANPAALGFTNNAAPCVNTTASPPTVCTTPATYVYWDAFHPTAAAGQLIAQRTIAAIGR